MKTNHIFLTLLFILFFVISISAQEKQGDRPAAFGGASFFNTTLAGEWAMEGGALGAGFLTDNIYLGGGGFGLAQNQNGYEYNMGYGGVILGYMWGSQEKTSMHFYTLGGFGGIEEKGKDTEINDDGFWVIKPAVEVDFEVARWLRIGVGGGYRWVVGANIPSLDNNDMSSPFGGVTFRFGNWR